MIAISDVSLDGGDLMIRCTNGNTVRIRSTEVHCRFEQEQARRSIEATYDNKHRAIVFAGPTHKLACMLNWSIKGALTHEQQAETA